MAIRPPSLRAVSAFEAAARTGSFTRAATELSLTPSAISHAVRGLEDRLGARLFDRSGRAVRLSPAGQDFAARVRMGLALLTDAMGGSRQGGADVLTISTTPSIARKLLVPRLSGVHVAFPGLSISLKITDALEDFSGAAADMALRFGPGEWAGLTSRILARETLSPMCSPDYRGGDLPRKINDLSQCNLIRHSASSWRLWLDPQGLDEREFTSTLLIDDAATALDAAMRGLGIALGRDLLACEDVDAGRLVRPLDGSVPAEYVYATVWPANAPRRALAERFSEWLSASLA